MSVPLDRLYNYLQDVVNHDILIYRWTPHGSKKLKDLRNLKHTNGLDHFILPYMICHDQEPLDYHQYDSDVEAFKNGFSRLNLPSELYQQVKTITCNSNLRLLLISNIYEKSILLHSELNSSQVELYKNNNFLPVYYWSHAVIARDWFRYAEHDPLLESRNPQRTFLIYNRAWSGTREYRLKFADMIVKNKLASSCIMGFNQYDGECQYHAHKFKNPAFSIDSTDLGDHFFKNTTLSSASADYTTQDYQESNIEIVLETLFDDTRWHLTEKTLRPIACGHPFILATTPGSLHYLRSYGFETFDGLIDESYDSIKDPVLRLQAIVLEMKRLTTVDATVWNQLRVIAARNKKRFFSAEFQEHLVNEYRNNLQSVMNNIDVYRTGKNWDIMYETTQYCWKSNTLHILDQVINLLPFFHNGLLAVDLLPLIESINNYIKTLK
jgi:hypothetical protein